ncbi:MAG: MBL fold metallo-hydrolase [Desulfobacteraceae bacterium]|nr:MBL fold metallo-hydrolase [Desulfobacteraceae bacterium]
MEIRFQAVGPYAMNAYVLICPATRQSVLIDPGAEPEALAKLLAGTTPVAILVTHAHPDHIGALDAMRGQLKVPIMAHGGNRFELPVDRRINDGELIDVGQSQLRVYHTPGHTRDQVSYRVQNGRIAVVGDTIFDGGPGKTWSAQDFQTTLGTLRKVILAWPDDTVCYPGHGASFRLGDIRGAVERFLAKDHGQFCGDATWEM